MFEGKPTDPILQFFGRIVGEPRVIAIIVPGGQGAPTMITRGSPDAGPDAFERAVNAADEPLFPAHATVPEPEPSQREYELLKELGAYRSRVFDAEARAAAAESFAIDAIRLLGNAIALFGKE